MFDPLVWLLLLLMALLLIFLYLNFKKRPAEPWVLYDGMNVDRTITDQCGDGGILVSTNNVRNMNVHIEIENRGGCKVTVSVGNAAVLEAKALAPGLGPRVAYVTAFVAYPMGASITYNCASDENETECVIRGKITVR